MKCEIGNIQRPTVPTLQHHDMCEVSRQYLCPVFSVPHTSHCRRPYSVSLVLGKSGKVSIPEAAGYSENSEACGDDDKVTTGPVRFALYHLIFCAARQDAKVDAVKRQFVRINLLHLVKFRGEVAEAADLPP